MRWYASFYWNNNGVIYPFCGSDSYMEIDGRLSRDNVHLVIQQGIVRRKKWLHSVILGYTLSRASRLKYHFDKEASLFIYLPGGISTSKKPDDPVL